MIALAKIGVNVTKAELEHAVKVANVITDDKVQKKLIVTGNATLTDNDDGTETLNVQGGGGSGTTDYIDLTNKPSINGVTLVGNKTTEDLQIQPGTPCFFSETAESSATIYHQYINDATLINGKFVVLITSTGFYNGTDNEKPGIYAITYHSYEDMSVTASALDSVLSDYDGHIKGYVANLYYNKVETDEAISAATATKQDTLVSGTNIKTVNGASLLGSGDIVVGGGDIDTAMSDMSENAVQNKVIKGYVDTEIDDNIGDAMRQIIGGSV